MLSRLSTLIGLATLAAGPVLAAPAASGEADADETVVVQAPRPPGSVPGTAVPELTLEPAEIEAYGASNLAELLVALTPQTGSARGRGDGPPVTLLNGRRTSGFAEFRFLPTEAIQRVEVFTEEVALQYGFSADQRVVNFILKPQFRALTVEVGGGSEAGGARTTTDLEANRLTITPMGRASVQADIEDLSAVLLSDLGGRLGQADPSLRSVLPDTDERDIGININRALDGMHGLTADLRFSTRGFLALLGADGERPGEAVVRRTVRDTWRAALTLDGTDYGWQWTALGQMEHAASDTLASGGPAPLATGSDTTTLETAFNATGPLFDLPAGPVRASFRAGARALDFSSFAFDPGVATEVVLDRDEAALRASLSFPLTSRREEVLGQLGDLSVTVSGQVQNLSDAGTLAGAGANLSWSPTRSVRLSLIADRSEAPPTLQQLGEPRTLTRAPDTAGRRKSTPAPRGAHRPDLQCVMVSVLPVRAFAPGQLCAQPQHRYVHTPANRSGCRSPLPRPLPAGRRRAPHPGRRQPGQCRKPAWRACSLVVELWPVHRAAGNWRTGAANAGPSAAVGSGAAAA
jgi:hypothetical protein